MEQYFEYGETEISHLRKKDKKLGAAINKIGILKRKINPDLFSALVGNMIGQQISIKSANTVRSKLSELCDMDIEPEKLHNLTVEEIQGCGMTMRKAGYIKNIAEAAVTKSVDFNILPSKSDEEIIKSLTSLNGVGVWTAEMLLIFSLMRPNVISYGDLAIRRGMMRLYGLDELPKEQFLHYAKRYFPFASAASLYLWEISVPDSEIKW
ncbi:MAG: DNA-3-methyladenine glycosylase [Defluviitaleaceae bacterium]|nr:DNA-3-methyladenine glycosylase [Defluviitaleaceae bacterium]